MIILREFRLQRILEPGSKLALKEQLADSIISKIFSKKRLDEDELYDVMDKLYENFHEVQKRLLEANNDSNTLLLYDITSTYFEGTKAEDGKYGHSRDKRWDRYQIVIGLVCNGEGLPNDELKVMVATMLEIHYPRHQG